MTEADDEAYEGDEAFDDEPDEVDEVDESDEVDEVELVIAHRVSGSVRVRLESVIRVDPVDCTDPAGAHDPRVLTALREAKLTLRAEEDVPRALVRALRATGVPPLFADSAWLARCRLLVFDDGRADVGGIAVGYASDIGFSVGDPGDE